MLALLAALALAPCHGAAARDPAHPCHVSPLVVHPAPEDALIEPAEPCAVVRRRAPEVCAFGAPAGRARTRFALVGDSHAAHWRAALAVVARAERWRGYSIDQSRCPFAALRKATPDAGACARWNAAVRSWFARHPRVSVVFVSQRRYVRAVLRPGLGSFATLVAALAGGWNGLPATVARIYALADVPYNRPATFACVERALGARRSPDRECAVPRAVALGPDPALAAVGQVPRARAIDLTSFMCGPRLCYPVVGGLLVHKDVGHLTRDFSATLGPYLLRRLRALRSTT
jgi:SGNH domain (fused to AT3 domains)